MQRGLPIEHDDVAVLHVALHLVPGLQHRLHVRLREVEAQAVVADDVARAWQLRWPVLDELLQLVDVEGSDDLGVGERGRDGARHAHLVDGEVRIGRDDGARREVDALAHEVAADAALLALQPLRDRLERAARTRGGGQLARHVILDEGGQVVLQQPCGLQLDVVGGAILLELTQRLVGADNVLELDGEIVLAACVRRVHLDGRAHVRRGNGDDGEHHPVGPRVVRVEAQTLRVLVADALENRVRTLWVHVDFPLVLVRRLLELRCDHQPVTLEVGLRSRARPALSLRLRKVHHCAQPLRRILLASRNGEALRVVAQLAVRGLFVAEDRRAREADATQCLEGGVDEGDVVHWLGELEVAKVARALLRVHAAGRAVDRAIDRAERRIHQATRDGLAPFEGAVRRHIAHRCLLQLLWAEDAELHTPNLAHVGLTVPERHAAHGCGAIA